MSLLARQAAQHPTSLIFKWSHYVGLSRKQIHTFHYWKLKNRVILSSYLWKPEQAHVILTPLLGYSCLGTWALRRSCGDVSFELCVVRYYSLLLASRPPWLLLTFQTYFFTLQTPLEDIINLTYPLESQSYFLLLATKNVNQRKW